MKRSGKVQIIMQRNIDYYESLSIELNFNTLTVFFLKLFVYRRVKMMNCFKDIELNTQVFTISFKFHYQNKQKLFEHH